MAIPSLLLKNPVATVSVLAAAILAATVAFQGVRIDRLKAQVELLETRASVAQEANSSNQETIKRLEDANRTLTDVLAAQADAVDRALQDAAEADRRAAADRARAADALASDLRRPDCAALGRIDLPAACPELARRLREAPDSSD